MKINIKCFLLIVILSLGITSTSGIEEIQKVINQENKIPEGFQRLSDVSFFQIANVPDAENILIPKRMYQQLEKEMGIPIDKSYKQFHKQDKQEYPTYNIVPNPEKKTIKIITPGTLNVYTSNIQKLWNRTEQESYYTSINAIPVPDLDGDKLPDVLETIYTEDSFSNQQIFLKVRKGTNGNLLWQQTIGPNSFATLKYVPDLNGDHIGDVLLSITDPDSQIAEFYAKVGKTGTNLWYDTAYEPDGYVYIDGYSPGDLNRDGLADIIEYTIGQDFLSGDVFYDYKIRKGINGTIFWTKSTSGQETYLFAYPTGDVNNDSYPDIMTVLYNRNEVSSNMNREVQMKKGSNGLNIWSSVVNLGTTWRRGSVIPTIDLSGDRSTDVLYWDYSNTTGTNYQWTIRTKNGKNGTTMWTNTTNGKKNQYNVIPQVMSDMNGDKINDILFLISNYGNITLSAKKGSNGNSLWNVYYGKGTYDIYINSMLFGDVNNDKIGDMIINIQKFKTGNVINLLQVRSGKTGAYIWQDSISSPTSAYFLLPLFVLKDANGDNIVDILINYIKYISGNRYHIYKVKSGNNGTTLWQESLNTTSESSYLFAIPGGDLNGDKLIDILRMSSKVANEHVMASKLAPTGIYRWQIRSTEDNKILARYNNFNGDTKQDILFTAGNEIYAITTK